ncbi:MAG TPA: penicillin-binding protein 2 [Terriglobales bacterium]|nr:penicillin-binding protein 2 [Terriglobales bacterium]
MVFGREEKVSPIRITAVQYLILAVFLVLGFGLWRLQVAGTDYYVSLAERNRVRTVPILAPRGKILDREGRVIVDNYPSFSALLLRDQTRDLTADVDKIAAGLHMDPDEVRDRIQKFRNTPQYQPLFLKDDITPDELAFIESHRNEIPELDTIMAHRRLYPKNGFMAHVIGYVGEVSEDMLNMPAFEFYKPGDIVGKSGVEQFYNDILMGKDGSRREVVDSRGRVVGKMDEVPAVPGKQLRLTIDLDLQIAAEQALEGKKGAIVAMNPKTGEILAMVSRPTFDPNQFAVRLTKQYWNQLVTDDGKPLMNKAIQAQLAPGSVFKIIMATAGTQEGITQNLHVNCGGGANFYGRYFKCWVVAEHRTHGVVDLPKGIYQSCDVYFYTLAERLGIGRIAKWSTALGLGQRTNVDLPQEVSGVMPSEEWKIRNFKQKWYAGETISVGIGQGAVATTPIQLMRAIGAITMEGKLVRPHVVTFDNLPENVRGHYKEIAARVPEATTVPIDPQNWELITDAMTEVVNPIGTAPSAHLNGIDFGGKTGSAQTISNAALAKLSGDRSRFKDNGWFVGVAPRRNPDIVVSVLIEQGEHGYLAARTAAQVIKAFVEKERKIQQNVAYAVPPGYVPKQPKPAADKQVAPATTTPAPATATPAAKLKAEDVEIAGVWSQRLDNEQDAMGSGRFRVTPDAKPKKRVTAAPGMTP